jgi:hypothetical protein
VIRFRHVTKELFSSVTPFLLGEPTAGAITRLHADWLFALRNWLRPKPTAENLKLLLDAEREGLGPFFV